MTDQTPSEGGLRSEESSENDLGEEKNVPVDDVSESSIVDRFSEITIIDQNGDANSQNVSKAATVATHIIVLIHGWMGNPAEMGYIRESIQNAAKTGSNANTEGSCVDHRFVIHSASCNCDKTDDGIAVGGSRLAHEINDLVKHVVDRSLESGSGDNSDSDGSNSLQKFTLSIVGNSLGGLYARHALAGIEWDIGGSESSAPPVMLIPMTFVTTATPHLGISQHTYVPLPRAAEFVVAQGMKETGRDFFQFTQVLEDLFCKDYFLDPLSSFQQRIAYINVYGTDFQVPTATAAFWVPDSDSPHYRVKQSSEEIVGDNESSTSSTPESIVMMLTTPRCLGPPTEGEEAAGEEKKGEEGDDKEEEICKKNNKADSTDVFMSWSKRLDRLGWTKILVDVRDDVPGVRKSIQTAIDASSSDGSEDDEEDEEGNDIGSKTSDSDPKSEDESKKKDDNEKVESADDKADTLDEEMNDENAEEEGNAGVVPDWTRKDNWTAGELLAEFKGGLLKASSKRESWWDLKPRLPVSINMCI